jgi:hypothetical protein
MSPAEKQAREEQADRKMRKATDKAYMGSLRNTEADEKSGRGAEKMSRLFRQMRDTKMPNTDEMGNPTGMKKGGVTRADGCVAKGHTKGKMVAMAKGGKAC